MRFKKGDTILVTSGKDKGKTGKIEKVLPASSKVVVAGINILKKNTKASKKNPHGGIIQINAPISASKISLICPRCNKQTRIGSKMLDNNKKLRICKKCKESVE